MRVLLPSKGILGQNSVRLKIPNFGLLHDLQTYNKDEFYRKYFIVQNCTNVKLNKVTGNDVDYLYTLILFLSCYNKIAYTVTCDCGHTESVDVRIADYDIKQLNLSKPYYYKVIKGFKYKFSLLSAQQEFDIYDWSQYSDNEELAFEESKVCAILGHDFKDVEYARKLKNYVYVAALLWPKINYHGIENVAKTTCPSCGKEISFRFEVNSSILDYNLDKLLDRFIGVSSYVSLDDFLKLSIHDYNHLVENINKRNR